MSGNQEPTLSVECNAQPPAKPAPAADGGSRWKDVYRGELDEVYLLFDFIAGRPDRNVSSLEVEISEQAVDPADATKTVHSKRVLSAPEVVGRISALRFPPDGTEVENAQDAGFLLMVKDRLCALAYPATAQSIAFTYFVTEAAAARARTGLLTRLRGAAPPASDVGSRGAVARRVYPDFQKNAQTFCTVRNIINIVTLMLALVGAFLLAEVTYGGQLTARMQAAKRDSAAAAEKIYTAELETRSQAASTTPPTPAAVKPTRVQDICPLPPDGPPAQAATADPTRDPTLIGNTNPRFIQLCDDYAYAAASYRNAINDVNAYARGWIGRSLRWIAPFHDLGPKDCPPTPTGSALDCGAKQETGPSLAATVSALANYFLPLIFGVVGAMSGMIRRVQDRIVESVLVPRDISLLWLRVLLGVVAGGSIGLFFDPVKVAAEITNGNSGLSVSASGLAFLAGYGAPAFFLMLDKALNRVFDFREDQAPAGAPPPPKTR